MPDFNKIISRLQDKRAAVQDQEQQSVHDEAQLQVEETVDPRLGKEYMAYAQAKASRENPAPQDPRTVNHDTSATSDVANDVSPGERAVQESTDALAGRSEFETPQVNGGYSPDEVYQDFLSKSADNVMVGFGGLLSSWGGVAQTVGGALIPGVDMYDGNILSRFLQEKGDQISQANQTYISPEMRDPNFKFSTYFKPEYWAVHGAQFVPTILEILAIEAATGGIAGAFEKGAAMGARGVSEGALAGSEEMLAATKGLRGTTTTLREGTFEIPGKVTNMGRIFRDTGDLTNTGKAAVKGISGGALMNVRMGLSAAAETYNSAKDMKDANGNDMFTKAELGQMASSTFSKNAQFLLADMANWGLTFGGGWKAINESLVAPSSKLLKNAAQGETMGALFSHEVSPMLTKLAQFGSKTGYQGMHQGVQMAWIDWSKFQGYKDVAGTADGYEGFKKDANGKTPDYKTFWDFYHSKDAEATKAIAFGLGAVSAGLFNVKDLINKKADLSHNLYNRAEAFKRGVKAGEKGAEAVETHIHEQMAELVFQGKEHLYPELAEMLKKNGVVDDKKAEYFDELFNDMQKTKSEIEPLNIKGKYAYLLNVARIKDIESKIAIETDKYTNNKKVIDTQLEKDSPEHTKAITLENNKYKEQVENLSYAQEQLNQNKSRLLSGKPAKETILDFETDENGNVKYVIRDPEEKPVVNNNGVEVQPEMPRRTILSRLTDKAKALVSGLGIDDFLNKELPKKSEEPVADRKITTKEQLKELQTKGLADNEQLFVNGKQVESHSIQDDIGDKTASLMDYQTVKPESDKLDYTTQENIDALKGQVIGTKDGLFNTSDETPADIVIKTKPAEDKPNEAPFTKPSAEEVSKTIFENNPKITVDDTAKRVSPEDYKNFVDNGEVKSGTLDYIAEKMIDSKKLTIKEEAVRQEFAKEVEALVKNKEAIEKEKNDSAVAEEQLTGPESEFVKKVSRRKSKATTLAEQDAIEVEKLKGKAPIKSDTLEDPFSEHDKNGMAKKASELDEDTNNGGTAKRDNTLIQKAKEKANELLSKARKGIAAIGKKEALNDKAKGILGTLKESFDSFKKEDLAEKLKTASDNLTNFHDTYEQDMHRYSQMRVVNERLRAMYPDAGVHVTNLDNVSGMVGYPALGYSLAGAIYIDNAHWQNDLVYHHEMSHIFYQLSPNTPEIEKVVSHALRNKPLFDQIMSDYDSQIYYDYVKLNGDTIRIRKGTILKQLLAKGEITDPSKLNGAIKMMLQEGNLKEVPMEEQALIREELFAHTMEGPMSKNYDKFFNLKDETVRKYLAKSFWGKIKERVVKAKEEFKSNDHVYFQSLAGDEKVEYINAKEYVLEKMAEGLKGKDLSTTGMAKYEEENAASTTKRLDVIAKDLKQQSENYFNSDFKTEDSKKKIKSAFDAMNEVEEYSSADATFYEQNRIKYVQKASEIIGSFSKLYNKAQKIKFLAKAKREGKEPNFNDLPFFDKDKLQIALFKMAKDSYSNEDFIDKIQTSKVEEIEKFNLFLDTVRPDDKLLTLSSMKYILGNQSNINSVVGYVSKNGEFALENNLGLKEKAQVENIRTKLYYDAGNFFKQTPGAKNYLDFTQTIEKIRSGNYDQHDLYSFLDMFSNSGIDTKSIMEENRINIDGKNFTVDTVVNKVIDKVFSAKRKNNPNISIYSIYDPKTKSGIDPILVNLIKSIVATNRKFTADYTVENAVGNQEPVRVIDNFLTRELGDIQKSALSMPRTKFLSRYGNTVTDGKGSKSNSLLNYMYDQINNGNAIDLNQYHGIKNLETGLNTTINDSSSGAQSIFEFLSYMANDNKNSYMMETGRFGDSPTSYMMRVPKAGIESHGAFTDDTFKFNPKGNASLENAFKTYNKLGGDQTLKEFESSLSNSIAKEIAFMEQNKESLQRIASTKNMLTDKGKLTPEAKAKVAEYVINQTFNGVNFSEIFLPSFKIDELSKRQKSLRSPGFRFGSHVNLENIYFPDTMEKFGDTEVESSNSGMYILAHQGDAIERAGGNLMQIGKGYKLLNTGIEHENPNFMNKNMFDKGFVTRLDDEFIAQNPSLKGMYDLMRQRYNEWEVNHGRHEEDLLNGKPTQIVVAMPLSSNKSGNLPNSFFNADGSLTEHGNAFSFDTLNKSTFEEQHKILDSWYYDQSKGSKEFMGLSGDNFVVQQKMDAETYNVNTPIQMVRAILTNAGTKGTLKLSEDIQRHIMNEQQSVLEEYKKVMDSNNPELIRDFVQDKIDLSAVDPLQRFLIVNDHLSMSTPALRELAKNTVSNAIRIAGNKLRTPGTLAQAKAATYEKEFSTNGGKNLQFYGQKSDGGHTQGEAVLPKYMNKAEDGRGQITAREYIVQDDSLSLNRPLNLLETEAKNKAKARGVGYKEVYNKDNVHVGYYVEGDSVIATRIPSHGPQTTGVFEAVGFDTTGASNVQLPTEFAIHITGGDLDGDQFFIQHKGKSDFAEWNQAFDKIKEHWLSPQMASEVKLPIDFKNEAKDAVKEVHSIYGNRSKGDVFFSPEGRRQSFNDTLISKGNIGISANLHSLLGMLSAYDTPLKNPISINGFKVDAFKDSPTESRTINSARVFNLVMDNAKNHFADQLGINEHTINQAMILRNLGYSLKEVGVILNSRPVLKINEILSNNESVFTEKKSINDIVEQVRRELRLKKTTAKNENVITSKLNMPEQENAVLDLMANLGSINEDIMHVSGIMQGHNSLENNPFILERQYDNYKEVINNKSNKGITISDGFKENPLVKNYENVFEFNSKVQSQLDPVNSKLGTAVFGKITEGIGKNLSNQQIKKIHNDIELFLTSRLLGMNNIDTAEMQRIQDTSMVKINDYIQNLKRTIVDEDKDDVRLSTTAYDNSLLFNKAIRVGTAGSNKFISLNNNYFNENMSLEERSRILTEYQALPDDLKRGLVIHDLIETGWKGPKSLFNIFGEDLKKQISDASSQQLVNKNTAVFGNSIPQELTKRIIQTNSNMFIERTYPFTAKGEVSDQFLGDPKNKNVIREMLKGQPVIFKYKGADGKMTIFQFEGWNRNQQADLISIKRTPENEMAFIKEEIQKSKYATYPADIYKNGVGVSSILDESTNSKNPEKVFNANNIELEEDTYNGGMSRREVASDYYKFTHELSKDELMHTLGIRNEEEVSKLRQDAIYETYKKERLKSEAYAKKYNAETVKKLTDEQLTNLYSGKKSVDGEDGFGWRDKIAYANVIRPIIMEIANRAGVEQVKHFNNPGYKGEDMGFFQSYFVANNVPSSQPEIQAMIRKMETEYRVFQREKTKYVGKINSVTEALYHEKFGYNPNSRNPLQFLKSLKNQLFKNPVDIYDTLYGALVEHQEVTDSSGRKIMNMKYKSPEVIESEYKAGTVSKAQYDFYKTTKEISDYLKPFNLSEGQPSREDYIPHTAPAWLEIKARRGLLGLAVNAKTFDERVYDITMDFKDPITGKLEQDVPFSHIENIYNMLSKSKNNLDQAKDFLLLKRKALGLAKKGINENGTSMRLSNVEAGSSIGDTFMNRFASSRSISATDMPSMDLNKAFTDYTHSALFNNGNEVFTGMNKMLPLVDGILALTDSRGDVNSKKYVQKVWKDFFLSGKKQETKGLSSKTLGALGISTDSVIDFLTKSSLIYWLGYNGLLLGGGLYAVSNVLIGKYSNIKSAGGATWATGEKRFWGGVNKFDITNPLKGVREANAILHHAGFMDINVYDNVSINHKNNIEKTLMSIALMPMTWSEHWIQGVDFLGRLTPEEWDVLKNGGRLPDERMNFLEEQVKKSHGKGYQATDQRMIQMYSWGRNWMQFARYIPTMYHDQFGKEDIDLHGNKHMGTYTALYKTIQKGVTGEWTPKTFMEYRNSLDAYEKKRLNQGLIGFGMLSVMWGAGVVGHRAANNGFFANANPILNPHIMKSKFMPRSMLMIQNLAK